MFKYDHLLGIEFNMADRNCYTLLRDFYRDNFDIILNDYPCPTNWFSSGLDLYNVLASTEGFDLINSHPRDWRPGDVIIMAIQSSTGSHAAILLDNNHILHHLVGQRSCVTAYGGMFRNTTVGVYRHRDVPDTTKTIINQDLRDLLPDNIRRQFENAYPKPDTGSE